MIRFNIKEGEVVLDMASLGLQAFRDIYEYDTSKKKIKARNMLLFVYHMSDLRPSNPMRDLSEAEKENECRAEAFGKANYFLDEEGERLLDAGIAAYVKFSINSEERMLKTVDEKIDEQNEILSKLDGIVYGNNGYEVSVENAEFAELSEDEQKDKKAELNKEYSDILNGVLKNLNTLYKMKGDLKKIILEGGDGKVRGNKESSLIEKGSLAKIESKHGNK